MHVPVGFEQDAPIVIIVPLKPTFAAAFAVGLIGAARLRLGGATWWQWG